MTESEITYEMLPEAVKKAFSSSEYANWKIDDIDKLERAGMEIIYVIEVETRSGNVEKALTERGSAPNGTSASLNCRQR